MYTLFYKALLKSISLNWKIYFSIKSIDFKEYNLDTLKAVHKNIYNTISPHGGVGGIEMQLENLLLEVQ